MRWLVCAAAWLLAPLAGLFAAATTRWGPTLWQLSQNHGVHLGDVVALGAGLAAAAGITLVALRYPASGTHDATDDLVVPTPPSPTEASPTQP